MSKTPKSAGRPISSSLLKLREKYPHHSPLWDESIYALPSGLITAIEKELSIFTKEDAQFEVDLAQAGGGGFFLGQPFGYLSMSNEPVEELDKELEVRYESAVASIKQMLTEDRLSAGFDADAIESAMRPDAKTDQKVLERREGYTGWLVTSAGFRSQRDAIRKECGSEIERLGWFPPFFPSAMGEVPNVPDEHAKLYWKFMEFYQTWGLTRMITWDLPVPLQPQWTATGRYYLPQAGGRAGIVVFVPWHLLRHRDFKLSDIADRRLAIESPPEIREWIEGKPKNWGPDRYATMLRIYVYLELALKRRYVDKIRGNQGRLDVAFARFLSEGFDDEATGLATIEKVRREMVSRLRSGE